MDCRERQHKETVKKRAIIQIILDLYQQILLADSFPAGMRALAFGAFLPPAKAASGCVCFLAAQQAAPYKG